MKKRKLFRDIKEENFVRGIVDVIIMFQDVIHQDALIRIIDAYAITPEELLSFDLADEENTKELIIDGKWWFEEEKGATK